MDKDHFLLRATHIHSADLDQTLHIGLKRVFDDELINYIHLDFLQKHNKEFYLFLKFLIW
jgi:hypothetical protein